MSPATFCRKTCPIDLHATRLARHPRNANTNRARHQRRCATESFSAPFSDSF
ncbi:hypothetical protein PISMIDRAFT_285124 [Pisolithus microcarpus 441]|uniref:Uncharacterized protein n=1 Tax=Pisolithus microcarpus 441 TaxID=765257 RepID=A0A0C9YMF3_9AGAM|nr:hypothetical protein PISMIDRAFT_285124 [Pisolithus microcarpus 441]